MRNMRGLHALILGIMVCSGCGGEYRGESVKTFPVSGKIVGGNQSPITSGTVVFVPTSTSTTARQAAGEIKPDGTYSLKTPNSGDGAAPGDYKIRLETSDTGAAVGSTKKKGATKGKLAPLYSDEDTSGLSYSVKPESNTFNITLEAGSK